MIHPDPDLPVDSEPLYQKGAVNPERQHFLPLSQIGAYRLDTEDAIQQVALRLGHSAKFIDAEGYEVEITAAAIDADKDRLAWVICRAKELGTKPYWVDIHFYLRAWVNDRPVIDWEP